MRILAIESSAVTASVAILEDDTLVAEYTINHKMTHSQTLLPMIDEIFSMVQLKPDDVDVIAVSKGPGSFTGLRIGAATGKGIALALDKKMVAVPTLAAMAYNLYGDSRYICPVMDARRKHLYSGIYTFDGDRLITVRDVNLESYDELAEELAGLDGQVVLVGDVTVKVMSGMMLSRLGNKLADKGLAGFEFATGIPGSIGGAVRMNAGAYGGEIKDIIVSADVLDRSGRLISLSRDELELGYRTSCIAAMDYIVVSAVFRLQKGDTDTIKALIKELAVKRRAKQPLEYPSAGSTFKRPQGFFAAKLIEDAGLKGVSVGGAMVSEKHSGFVVNTGNATAKDVCMLTDMVKDKVKQQSGVDLELEVIKLGDFS